MLGFLFGRALLAEEGVCYLLSVCAVFAEIEEGGQMFGV